ncbi:MAG: AAA domain-containing protein [Myxococcota bacterium]|nr:AAA domain-containing protein [Myxococcota bacterium]
MHPHLQALQRALEDESAYRKRELERQLSLSLDQRVAEGVSWPPLQVVDIEWTRRGPRLLLESGAPLHEGLDAGAPITLSPPARVSGLPGTLLEVEGRLAVVQLSGDQLPDWVEQGRVVVSQRPDEDTLALLKATLQRAELSEGPLKAQLLGAPLPEPEPQVTLPGLNAAQTTAAAEALGSPHLAAIHGPPGTGKTTTLVAMVQHLVAQGQRPWTLADSNAAVDHLALSLHAAGVKVLRLGHPARMRPEARPLGLEAALAAGPYAKALELLDKDIRKAAQESRWRDRRALLREHRQLRQQARDQAMSSAQVLALTLGTLLRRADQLPEAHTALVDEATQAIEPLLWALVPRVQRLILLGDPHQLGPVVTQPGNPLERSLLDRLLQEQRLTLSMLEIQHRMGAPLGSLVSPIYGPSYRPHPAVADRSLCDLVKAPPDWARRGVFFLDTAGAGFEERLDPRSKSTENPDEVRVLAELWRQLSLAGVQPEQCVALTPYRAQVDALRNHPDLAGIRCATLNAWQGREEEVVLCSFVRSNPLGDLGFVRDIRRLTVALTRAKRLFAGVGDSATLSNHPRFAQLVDQMIELDALDTIWSEPWLGLHS